MTNSAITIVSIVALAKVMSYSGMIKSIAVVLVSVTGSAYPLIAPVIGALGTFVTGSEYIGKRIVWRAASRSG